MQEKRPGRRAGSNTTRAGSHRPIGGRAVVGSIAAASLVLAACAGGGAGPSSVPVTSRTHRPPAEGRSTAPARKNPKASAGKPARSETTRSQKPTATQPDDERPDLSRAAARVADPVGDPQTYGSPPGYPDITGASVAGVGASVRLTLELAEEAPDTMPDDNTRMIAAWNFSGDRKNDSSGLMAQATTEGWTVASGSSKADMQPLDGQFEIDGNRLVITMPWATIGGPRRFRWSASVTWISTTAVESHSSSDAVRNSRYPN